MTLATVERYQPTRLVSTANHAVVVGAGISGLLAARVLADRYEEVTIVERDPLPGDISPRPGVPQSNHVHALLEAGRATLEDFFPGFTDAVRDAGGVIIDAASEFHYYHRGGFLTDGPERLPMLCASRSLFEHVVREAIADRRAVTIRSACGFSDYLHDSDQERVRGIELRNEAGEAEQLPADLVIDATGRASRTPRWLERTGYSPPEPIDVRIDLTYNTVIIARPTAETRGYLVAPSPSLPRGGTAVPIENNQWVVTLFGLHGDHPPATVDGLKAFAASLPTPELADLLERSEWLSEEVHRYPFRSSRRFRYETLDRFPDGLLVTGDAIASFNPIYGQGMSVAALDALHLHHALAECRGENLAAAYFDRVSETIDTIWRLTVSADFDFPDTEGPRPWHTPLLNWYQARLIEAAHEDPVVVDTFARVLRLEKPPSALLTPEIVARVLFSPVLKRRLVS